MLIGYLLCEKRLHLVFLKDMKVLILPIVSLVDQNSVDVVS